MNDTNDANPDAGLSAEAYIRTLVDSKIKERLRIIDQKIDRNDKVGKAFDFIALVVAAVVALFTWRLSVSTDSLRDDSAKQVENAKFSLNQTNIALSISKDSLAEASKSNQYVISNFVLQQRAYVIFENWQENGIDDFGVTIENAGLTPAIKFIHNRRLMIVKYSEFIGAVAVSDQNDFDPQNDQVATLGPGSTAPLQSVSMTDANFHLYKPTSSDFYKFKSGEYIVGLSGIVRYNDIFGKPHTSTYCGYFSKGNLKSITYCRIHSDIR